MKETRYHSLLAQLVDSIATRLDVHLGHVAQGKETASGSLAFFKFDMASEFIGRDADRLCLRHIMASQHEFSKQRVFL